MTTLVKKGKQITTATSTRMSPRTLANLQFIEESTLEEEQGDVQVQEEAEVPAIYFPPRPENAPEVDIPKGFKYQIILPPVDDRVKADGDLWGHTHVVKFVDYNLGDSKTYPQFRQDNYMII